MRAVQGGAQIQLISCANSHRSDSPTIVMLSGAKHLYRYDALRREQFRRG